MRNRRFSIDALANTALGIRKLRGIENIKFLLLQTYVRGDGSPLLRADEKLTAFLELESAIRACGEFT
jgi:hypothetical protein